MERVSEENTHSSLNAKYPDKKMRLVLGWIRCALFVRACVCVCVVCVCGGREQNK